MFVVTTGIILLKGNPCRKKISCDAIKDSHSLISSVKPEGTIDYYSDTVYRERCNKYTKYLFVFREGKVLL